MSFHEFLTDCLPYLVTALVALVSWLVKQMYQLLAWKVQIADTPMRVRSLEDWQLKHAAELKPTADALNQIPVLSRQLERHSEELSLMRENSIRLREANQTKLDIVLHKLDSIEENCVLHRLVRSRQVADISKLFDVDAAADEER